MYRGIIQHKTYETPYLINEIRKRDLSAPLSCGRIYKIVPTAKRVKSTSIGETPQALVEQLGDPNGFIRDMAQQAIIDNKFTRAIPYLKQSLTDKNNPLKVIHALWTLEGLNALETNEVLAVLKYSDWHIKAQGLTVLPSVINGSSYGFYEKAMQDIFNEGDDRLMPYLAFCANFISPYSQEFADHLLITLAKKYSNNSYVSDAVISNLAYREGDFKKEISKSLPDMNLRIHKQLQTVLNGIRATNKNRDPDLLAKMYPKGYLIFQSTCQTCHGPDGNGIKSLAPPLNKSEWVNGNPDTFISIVLYGLTGPIKVNGKVYEAPEISGDMPPIVHNEELSDEDIAQLLSFVRGSWQNNANRIETKDVTAVRNKLKGRQDAFTQNELMGIK